MNCVSRLRLSRGVLVSALLVLCSCVSAEERARDAAREKAAARLTVARIYADSLRVLDSIRAARLQAAEEEFSAVTYRTVHIANRAVLDSIRKAFDYGKLKSERYKTFVTMNRRVFGSVRIGDTVVVPDKIVDDVRAYSVFPQLWIEAEEIPKLIVISNAQQSYACYENGKQVRFAACNTGTESKPTLPGRYAINWKERLRISSLNENWKLPFNLNFHLFAGNAFHQYYMPGRPASHSCIRQFIDDAKWLFEWAQVGTRNRGGRVIRFTGTPVIIIDMFDYARPKFGPWLDLKGNRDEKLELPEDPMGVEEALIPISQIPPSIRGLLPDRHRYKHAEDTLRARGVIRKEARLAPSIEYTRLKRERERRRQQEQNAEETNESQPAPSTPAPSTPPSATEE
ncbi:MAG: L,D-transpeptidase [Chlorobi bacterium]|nr:L,D-transpeptidase [Chlorobiota bacterium]